MLDSPFSKLTNLYSLSKTLRFELKPTPETVELLKKTDLQGKTPIQVDKDINDTYTSVMKPLFDLLHESFINESLQKLELDLLDLKNLEDLYLEYKRLQNDRKKNQERINELWGNREEGEIQKVQDKLRRQIVDRFKKQGEEWKARYSKIKLNDKGYKVLTNAKILDVLLVLYPEKSEAIDKFKGFFTYFSGFNQNRENYYTDEAKATGVANRIVNINLPIFLDDKVSFHLLVEQGLKLDEYEKYFELSNYKDYLTQEGIEKFNEIVGNINQQKNLFLQQENSKNTDKNKKIYLPNLKELQKQIGCRTKQEKALENEGKSIYPEYLEKVGLGFQITKDEKGKYQIWQALDYLNNRYKDKLERIKINYSNFFTSWNEHDLGGIWFRKESVNTISSIWFGGQNWHVLADALKSIGVGRVDKGEYKIPSFVSLSELKEAMEKLPMYEAENLFKEEYKSKNLFKPTLFETFLSIWQWEIESKLKNLQEKIVEFNKASMEPFDKSKKVEEGKSSQTELVKDLVEGGYLRLFQMTKYHNLEKRGQKTPLPTDRRFYDELEKFWEENQIVTYHKAFQSTLTKKPYSDRKIKLNFGSGSLLSGWSAKYDSYGALIFNKENKYYLGLISGSKFSDIELKSLFENIKLSNQAKRLVYLTQKIDNKNPPRWFIRSKGKNYSPMVREGLLNPKDILDIYDKKLFSKIKNKNNYREYLSKLIDYFKDGFRKHKDFKNFSFTWLDSKMYESIDKFYEHTADLCYKLQWEEVNFEAISNLVKKGRLYLFQIYNKDLELDSGIGISKFGSDFKVQRACGKLNSHTKLFLELLNPDNVLKIKLLGNAEIFFREANKKEYKVIKSGKYKGKEVLDAKRFYEQKYILHFPIELKGSNLRGSFNHLLNKTIQDHPENFKVIGIDRGEKHLLYYSVVDQGGRIIEQGSLNEINGVDYNTKLQEKQNKRKQARLNWETIGNIKNFKEGYLSQAIHKIYELIIKYNSIVALENLNSEFKAKRLAKVEKSIYKKFELALARKLNHLILKDKNPTDLGGALNAYQLTPAVAQGDVKKFEKANQWGIMFYVRANYTSTTDPLTGWRKHKYISYSDPIEEIKEFFDPDGGVLINYDNDRKCFRFDYVYEGRNWKLYAFKGIKRFYWNGKKREMEEYDLHEEFEKIFSIFDKSRNINEQMLENSFDWKRLSFLWNLLNQIRNIDREKSGNDNDFIQSPAWSEKYRTFFDSREVTTMGLPDNGDANGAYNIARKGLIILNRLKKCSDTSKFGNDNNGKNPENGYYISDAVWDDFTSKNTQG